MIPLRGRIIVQKIEQERSRLVLPFGSGSEAKSQNLERREADEMEHFQVRADLGRVLAIAPADAARLDLSVGDLISFRQHSAWHWDWELWWRAAHRFALRLGAQRLAFWLERKRPAHQKRSIYLTQIGAYLRGYARTMRYKMEREAGIGAHKLALPPVVSNERLEAILACSSVLPTPAELRLFEEVLQLDLDLPTPGDDSMPDMTLSEHDYVEYVRAYQRNAVIPPKAPPRPLGKWRLAKRDADVLGAIFGLDEVTMLPPEAMLGKLDHMPGPGEVM